MSKKITIPLNNIRWQLHDLFHEYLDEIYSYRHSSSHRRMSRYDWADDDEVMWLMQQGVIFPGMEDDMANFYDGDDDWDDERFHYENREEVLDAECIWPPKEDTSKKKGKKKKSLDPYGDYWNMIDALEGKKTQLSMVVMMTLMQVVLLMAKRYGIIQTIITRVID